ncbi:MAG: hypothetical protein ACXVW4_01630 [Nocardioides sp.]
MTPGPLPLHLGAMHAHEQVLTLVVAFGPFLLLGLVVAVRRRQDAREDALAADAVDTVDTVDREGTPQRER